MKKSFLLLILSSLSLTGCSIESADNNKNNGGNNDNPQPVNPIEEHTHTDTNKDHMCDDCHEKVSECVDTNKDHICDICEKKISDCVDVDKNNVCDICGATLKTEEEGIVVTIPMCGSTFANSFNVGVDLTADYSYESVLNYLKSIGDTNYINAYSGYCLNTNDYDNCRYFTVGTGYFAKGKFQAGSFTICSSVEILKVEVIAKAYMNSYPGYGAQQGQTIYQPDYEASILLDNEETSLAVASDATETISKPVSKDYSASGGVKQFTIESKGGRVFVEEIKITWKGQNS